MVMAFITHGKDFVILQQEKTCTSDKSYCLKPESVGECDRDFRPLFGRLFEGDPRGFGLLSEERSHVSRKGLKINLA